MVRFSNWSKRLRRKRGLKCARGGRAGMAVVRGGMWWFRGGGALVRWPAAVPHVHEPQLRWPPARPGPGASAPLASAPETWPPQRLNSSPHCCCCSPFLQVLAPFSSLQPLKITVECAIPYQLTVAH